MSIDRKMKLNLRSGAVILFVLLLVWVFVRFVLGGSEDDWICVEGDWVKHGYPSAPMPDQDCG